MCVSQPMHGHLLHKSFPTLYIGVTAHYYLNASFKSIALGVHNIREEHTAANMAAKLTKIFNDYGIKEKVIGKL